MLIDFLVTLNSSFFFYVCISEACVMPVMVCSVFICYTLLLLKCFSAVCDSALEGLV